MIWYVRKKESWSAVACAMWAIVCVSQAHGQCYWNGSQWVCPQPQAQWQPQENIVQQSGWNDPRVVLLEDGGTGAFIIANGREMILSCAHESAYRSIRVGQQLAFRTNSGRRYVATVASVDPRSDCALLTFPQPLASHIRPFEISETPLQPGETVYIAGFPMGRYRTRTATVQQDGTELHLTGSATAGESGGPIVNGRGEIVGVLFGDELNPQSGRSIGRTLCCGRGPIRALLKDVLDGAANIVATATGQRSHGSPGGTYQGQQPNPYGQPPLVPVAPIPQPVAEIDPKPPTPQPEIDWDAWGAKQDEDQKQIVDGQNKLENRFQEFNLNITNAFQAQSDLNAEQLAVLKSINDSLADIGTGQTQINMQLAHIDGRITSIESKPSEQPSGTTAPAQRPKIYARIVPKK